MKSRSLKFKSGVFIILVAVLASCREDILHNLSEGEANRLTTLLHDRGITAEKTSQADLRWTLSVDQKAAVDALRFLTTYHLVRENRDVSRERDGIMSSRDEERRRMAENIGAKLEGTLQAIPGVIEARVHINLPSGDSVLDGSVERKSASSVIVIEDGTNLPTDEIREVISGASGVASRDVGVMITKIPPFKEEEKPKEKKGTELEDLISLFGSQWGSFALMGVGCGIIIPLLAILLSKRTRRRKLIYDLCKE